MSELIVTCNSLEGVVEYKSEHGILSTLTWGLPEETITGFYVKNADILMDVHQHLFYVVDPAAVVQFLMNVGAKIMDDQGLESVIYMNMEGEKKTLPYFLPNNVADDDEVLMLPHLQIAIAQLWREYILNYNGYLNIDIIDAAHERGILEAFLDLVNVELSLLITKGDDEDE